MVWLLLRLYNFGCIYMYIINLCLFRLLNNVNNDLIILKKKYID